MAQGRRTFVAVTGKRAVVGGKREGVRERERGGRESIWLNRNGRGDIFKPGKVWCLVLTRGCAGRASHKFTLSYHLIATIAAQALGAAHGARQEVDRNLAHEKSPWNYRRRSLRGETKM